MAGHDIIVMGASAGGVEALPQILSGLPEKFPASVFVVLHVPAQARSNLPKIIQRQARLPTRHAEDGERIRRGRIYVAPPDLHLRLESDCVRLVRGPKENRHRPAVDPLFRSAAKSYGPRVVGLVLTGALDDGTQGLDVIKKCGGVAIVQNPDEAAMPGMPLSALRYVEVDQILTLKQMPAALVRLARTSPSGKPSPACAEAHREPGMMEADLNIEKMHAKVGPPSGFICPDCNGPLWETPYGDLPHFRCFAGHAFSPESLMAGEADSVERALWIAFKTLEERATLLDKLAARAGELDQNIIGAGFRQSARDHRHQARIVRGLLDRVGVRRQKVSRKSRGRRGVEAG